MQRGSGRFLGILQAVASALKSELVRSEVLDIQNRIMLEAKLSIVGAHCFTCARCKLEPVAKDIQHPAKELARTARSVHSHHIDPFLHCVICWLPMRVKLATTLQ